MLCLHVALSILFTATLFVAFSGRSGFPMAPRVLATSSVAGALYFGVLVLIQEFLAPARLKKLIESRATEEKIARWLRSNFIYSDNAIQYCSIPTVFIIPFWVIVYFYVSPPWSYRPFGTWLVERVLQFFGLSRNPHAVFTWIVSAIGLFFFVGLGTMLCGGLIEWASGRISGRRRTVLTVKESEYPPCRAIAAKWEAAKKKKLEPITLSQVSSRRLDGILIIFTKDFEPKYVFIDSILTKMRARGQTYKEWMTADTPVRVLIDPSAQNPMTYIARATVQFQRMGVDFSLENVEHATFEGNQGISGVVVTHWSKRRRSRD